MHRRTILKVRPGLERLEGKQLLSASTLSAHAENLKNGSRALALHPAHASPAAKTASAAATNQAESTQPTSPGTALLGYRITNPNRFNNSLTPPFQHVLVQSIQPVPGQVYNILFISVRNGTARTFTASNGFLVRLPGGKTFPVLTGNQEWKPGEVFVFYVLTKKYYPVSEIGGGFEFDMGGGTFTLVPGPSGIFLRLKYNPATFDHSLDQIVAFGPGSQGGKGYFFGLPVTSVNEIVSARTRRSDFGGRF
jgi:hypothetical protein